MLRDHAQRPIEHLRTLAVLGDHTSRRIEHLGIALGLRTLGLDRVLERRLAIDRLVQHRVRTIASPKLERTTHPLVKIILQQRVAVLPLAALRRRLPRLPRLLGTAILDALDRRIAHAAPPVLPVVDRDRHDVHVVRRLVAVPADHRDDRVRPHDVARPVRTPALESLLLLARPRVIETVLGARVPTRTLHHELDAVVRRPTDALAGGGATGTLVEEPLNRAQRARLVVVGGVQLERELALRNFAPIGGTAAPAVVLEEVADPRVCHDPKHLQTALALRLRPRPLPCLSCISCLRHHAPPPTPLAATVTSIAAGGSYAGDPLHNDFVIIGRCATGGLRAAPGENQRPSPRPDGRRSRLRAHLTVHPVRAFGARHGQRPASPGR